MWRGAVCCTDRSKCRCFCELQADSICERSDRHAIGHPGSHRWGSRESERCKLGLGFVAGERPCRANAPRGPAPSHHTSSGVAASLDCDAWSAAAAATDAHCHAWRPPCQGIHTNSLSLFRLTSFARRSFSTAAPLTWNSLPPAVLNCDSLSTFKSRLIIHLFSTALC